MVSAAQIKAVHAALSQNLPHETMLRDAIKARLRGVAEDDGSAWPFRILAHEIAQPTPAMTDIINNVMRPLFSQLFELVGALIGHPVADERTRLSVRTASWANSSFTCLRARF